MKEDIKDIKKMLQDIAKRLSQGDVSLATIKLRLRVVELLVYGGVALTMAWAVKGVLLKAFGV